MLQARNLSAVLAQSIHSTNNNSPSQVFSSILCTSSGTPVASSHSSIPQILTTRSQPGSYSQLRSNSTASLTSASSSSTSSSLSTTSSMQYALNRPLKTKVYCLFASSLWTKYYRPRDKRSWVSVLTDDALLLILPVHLASSSLQLLVLVAELGAPLGSLLRKAQETVRVLESGLQNYKIYD